MIMNKHQNQIVVIKKKVNTDILISLNFLHAKLLSDIL